MRKGNKGCRENGKGHEFRTISEGKRNEKKMQGDRKGRKGKEEEAGKRKQ